MMYIVMNIVTRNGYVSCTFPGNIFDPIEERFRNEEVKKTGCSFMNKTSK